MPAAAAAAPADVPVAAATLELVAAKHGGRAFPSYHPLAQPGGPATRHGDATQPCTQPRAGDQGDAPPPQGEAAAGGAAASEEACVDGADCLKLAPRPAAPRSVLVHHDAARRPVSRRA